MMIQEAEMVFYSCSFPGQVPRVVKGEIYHESDKARDTLSLC